jgi:subtilisin
VSRVTRQLLFCLLLTLLVAVFSGKVQGQIDDLPWGVERIRGDLPWDSDRNLIVDPDANAGEGVRVAVLDTGVWKDHPDLTGRVVGGISYVEGEQYWEDNYGHGTYVAGIIAAIDGGNHLIGVAPKVELLAVKVWPATEGELVRNLLHGIKWAVDNGADVISMSLGFYNEYPALEVACRNAYDSGVLLIGAAGNENRDVLVYPAKYSYVIAVGATNQSDKRWVDPLEGSNFGPELELAAPGANINSTCSPPLYYVNGSGTSAAAPHVSGTAALILGSKVDPDYDTFENGQWDNFEVRQKLQDTALDLGSAGRDEYYGYGLVNAWRSLQRPEGDITRDLCVDAEDLRWVGAYYGKTSSDPDWWALIRPADIDISNRIDTVDVSIVGLNWGKVDP